MRKIFFFFLFIINAPNLLLSQHCAYDYYAIVVLHITDSSSDEVIKNLKVTLIGIDKKPITVQRWTGKQYATDTVKFWQNPQTTTTSGVIDNEHPWMYQNVNFWFAKDNYIWICDRSYAIERCTILIEDMDAKRKGGKYRTKGVRMSGRQVYPLCTHFSNWDQGEQAGFIKSYEPVNVYLEKK